jgi:hypothetical protein
VDVLLNLQGDTTRALSRILQPLEVLRHIHVVINPVSQTIEITIPRLQLNFYIMHGDLQVHSRQYRGTTIDNDQSIGILIGLTSRLVLKNANNNVRS